MIIHDIALYWKALDATGEKELRQIKSLCFTQKGKAAIESIIRKRYERAEH